MTRSSARALWTVLSPAARSASRLPAVKIANSVLILRTFAEELKRIGAKPYIVPAMGSHGGATAEGQRAILDHYGITEEACGCEIHATMETKKVGVSAEDWTCVWMPLPSLVITLCPWPGLSPIRTSTAL